MLIPFLAPFLVYLDLAIVFYPLALALMLLSIICLPGDLSPIKNKHRDEYYGNPGLSVIFNVVLFAVVIYHFGIDVGSWKTWIAALVVYLVIGVFWATGKWWMYCGKVRDILKEVIDRFNRTVEPGDNDNEVALGFMKYLIGHSALREYQSAPYVHENTTPWPREKVIALFIPLVTSHKAAVLLWIFCWPMSILKWALADMLRDLYNGVFSAIKGVFQKIAAKRFSGI